MADPMSSTNADRVASGPLAAGSVPKEVTWDGLDKRKFFVVGAGMFSCVTCALYPLTVIKTRQMVDGSVPGGGRPPPALSIVRDIVKERGIPGLYRGFGTIVVGTLPIRFVYLSTLEVVQQRPRTVCEALDLPPMAHGIADAAGGATASMCSQVLGVPVDIISQRQMVQGVSVRAASGEGTVRLQGYRNGVDALRTIVRTEGVRGLYRGFGASIATLVPGSAIWWGFYGTYQRMFWSTVPAELGGARVREKAPSHDALGDHDEATQAFKAAVERGTAASSAIDAETGVAVEPGESTVVAVQVASGVCAGATSGFMTTPLDIVKTRLQVLSGPQGGASGVPGVRHTFWSTAAELYRQHGASGFFRGVKPRMMSVSIWGTTMVTTYEFLKRTSKMDT